MADDSDPSFAYSRIPSGPSTWDDTPTHELVIDYAGNWIFQPLPPLINAQPPAPSPQPPEPPWEQPDQAPWQAPEAEPAPRAVPIRRRLPVPAPVLPSAKVYARRGAGAEPAPAPCTTEGLQAILRATKAHLDAHHGDAVAAFAAAKAFGANPDGYRTEPPPPVWPYGISEAQAAKMFRAGCQAAHDTATSAEVRAQAEQQQRTTVHHAVSVMGQARRRIEVVNSSTQGQQNGLPVREAASSTSTPDLYAGGRALTHSAKERANRKTTPHAAHNPISLTSELGALAHQVARGAYRLLQDLDPMGAARAAEGSEDDPEALKIKKALIDETTLERSENGQPPSLQGNLPIESMDAGRRPQPSPNFRQPQNPPSNPPTAEELPTGHTVEVMPPTAQYPHGYWKQLNATRQPVDPSTGRPPSNVTRPESRSMTHVALPSPKESTPLEDPTPLEDLTPLDPFL